MGKFVKGAGIFARNVGRKNRKCEEFLICAYGFLTILCVFLIFAYQILGRDCEFFVNRGPGAAAWGILWARRYGDFAGPCGRFGTRVYPYTARRYKAVQRLYTGRIKQKKNRPQKRAAVYFGLFVAAGLLELRRSVKITGHVFFSVAGGLFRPALCGHVVD